MTPPLLGQYAPATGMDQNAMGNGAQPGGQPDAQAQIAKLREIADPLRQFYDALPALQPLAKKFDALLRETLVAMAAQQSQQTPSSQALPMGG